MQIYTHFLAVVLKEKRRSEDKLDGEFGKIVNISIFWKTLSDFNIIHTHLLETDVLQFDFYISLNCSGMR
jgi:hypothetical protein